MHDRLEMLARDVVNPAVPRETIAAELRTLASRRRIDDIELRREGWEAGHYEATQEQQGKAGGVLVLDVGHGKVLGEMMGRIFGPAGKAVSEQESAEIKALHAAQIALAKLTTPSAHSPDAGVTATKSCLWPDCRNLCAGKSACQPAALTPQAKTQEPQ